MARRVGFDEASHTLPVWKVAEHHGEWGHFQYNVMSPEETFGSKNTAIREAKKKAESDNVAGYVAWSGPIGEHGSEITHVNLRDEWLEGAYILFTGGRGHSGSNYDPRENYFPTYHVYEDSGEWKICKDDPDNGQCIEKTTRKREAFKRAKSLARNNDYAFAVIWSGGPPRPTESMPDEVWYNTEWFKQNGALFVESANTPR
jgi:hypothetical protein